VIYLYAIGERDSRLVAFVRSGIDHAPAPDPEALADHDRVVWSLAERSAVLPMRFGTVVAGEADVRDLLTQRRDELRERLAHVRGRVEMGVRATWEEPPSATPRSGRAFMQDRLDRHSAARRRADELHPRLAELAVDSVLRLTPHEDTAFSAAYLVERGAIDRFAERAPREVTLTGPWPPYSFSRP
jgi:hypothetical protein